MTTMLRALVAVCLLASLAQAAPKYTRAPITATDQDLAAAETAWTAAAAEKDPGKRSAGWEAAAAAFIKVVDAGRVTRSLQEEAAYAAVLAWKNAIDVDPRLVRVTGNANQDFDRVPTPQTLDARDLAVIHAFDVYLKLAPQPDEAADVKFLRANVLRRRDHIEKAIVGYLDILEHHRDHEVAEYAANLALDGYNLLQSYDQLIALAKKLHADKKFLAAKPDLAAVVGRIAEVAARKESEAMVRVARQSGDLAFFDKCGEKYLSLVDEPGIAAGDVEEVRYNAGACFQEAGSIARAVATFRELIKKHPSSRLSWRAIARIGVSEAKVAHYREAAEALEEYVERFPGEKDAVDAGSDAVLYAVVAGDLARAAHIADLVTKNYGAKRPRDVVEVTLVVLDAQLAAGKRKDAAAGARNAARNAASNAVLLRQRDPALALRAGLAFAAAACPVDLVDELCPKPRDRALVAAARVQLARALDPRSLPDPDPPADWATRVALDLDLEAVLATRPPRPSTARVRGGAAVLVGRSITPAADAVLRGLERLIVDARTADVRIAARARLGTLHRHLGDRDKAVLALHACVTDARATAAGSEWLARCDRDLTALGEPDVDRLRERLALPTAPPVIVVEEPRYGTAQVPR